jgi:hypothetical protein
MITKEYEACRWVGESGNREIRSDQYVLYIHENVTQDPIKMYH